VGKILREGEKGLAVRKNKRIRVQFMDGALVIAIGVNQ
jgi:hypothetical protein